MEAHTEHEIDLAGGTPAFPSSPARMAALAAAGTGAFLNLYTPQPLLPTLARSFQASPGEVGRTVGATTLAVALSAAFAGRLSDRFGRRRAIVVSLFGLAATTLLCSQASGLSELVAFRFLVGLFMPGVIASAMAYIAEEWGDQAPRAMALYVTSTVFGGFLGRMVAGLVGDQGNWRLSFGVVGALTLAAAATVARWLPSSRARSTSAQEGDLLTEIVHHAGNPRLLASWAAGFGVLFSLVGTFTFLPFHLAAAPYSLGPASQGAIFLVYLLGLVVTPLSGRWVERYGATPTVIAATAASCLGVLLTLSGPLAAVVAGLALCASGVFVCQATASQFVARSADRSRSVASGLYVASYYAGGSVGAALSGFAWHLGGWAGCVALVVLVQAGVAGVVAVGWRESESPVEASAAG